ncbi:MAG TPA: HD domain-containing protein [Candidatus Limnocylindria bacterium]|nr:HD domain-containing protein [Candidatus Limnocylindria bacterium]
MSLAAQLEGAFPDLAGIAQPSLRTFVRDFWQYVNDVNAQWRDLEAIPIFPSLPIDIHGNLANHIRAMARVAATAVPTYAELWRIELSLDDFLTAVYVHDAAKVIEFVRKDGELTAIPGFNHALEAGRIVRDLGGAEEIAHMVECHSFAGPLVVPRTRAAQLFLFIDPLCLPVFPEQGKGAVERHLDANGWRDPMTKDRYRSPLPR